MTLGLKYLEKKNKAKEIHTKISLGHVTDSIVPMLHTLNELKPKDEVIDIVFDWHNIKDNICPITIRVRKESSRPMTSKISG